MNRVFLLSLVLLFSACQGSETNIRSQNVQDGESGVATNARRTAMRGHLQELVESKTIAEENLAITRLLNAVKKGQYKLQVRRNSKELSKADLEQAAVKESALSLEIGCPYFPPVTPWVSHKFHDYKNALALKEVILEP